jgi:histidine ammonia-lyase
VVRLILVLKLAALGRGHSGVSRGLVEALLAFLAADVLPCVPSKGSVGASGDLVPLAHLTAALIGEGEVRIEGRVAPAAEGLAAAGIGAYVLGPKEGLAMLNGTQVSTALALVGLFGVHDVFAAAIVAGALSVDAVLGSDVPFDARIQAVRGQIGQTDVAEALRTLLAGSGIRASHLTCHRVQDPYSLRCQPQVMGSCLDAMRFAAGLLEREANGVSDNPLVFAASGEVLSGGNFHAQPVALAADTLALAIAEIGNLAERRIALLTNTAMSGLPAFLVAEPGLDSGFMAPQIAAAALASENKSRAHPAGIDSIPTAADQEDHVSMATFAARRLADMVDNAATIIAIELMAAAQGIDFHAPLVTSEALLPAYQAVRERVPFIASDRRLAPEIARVADEVVKNGPCRDLVVACRLS